MSYTTNTEVIFQRLPVLEIDGKQYSQSMAIASYLARQFGFHGENDVEVMEIDTVLGIVTDIFACLSQAFREKDETRKAEMVKDNNETQFPRFVGFFETILKNNNTGFYVGDKLGLADLGAFHVLESVGESIIDKFPLVKTNMAKVRANEKIAEWLAKRPVTSM